MAITTTDDIDILNLLSGIPQTNDEYEQTLLFASFCYFYNKTIDHHSSVANKLEETKEKYNIVALCFMFSVLCTQSEKWLDKQKVIYSESFDYVGFNPHLQQILFDVANNPQ